jgi:ppGpp synthetase/RelA/SpoT-type nucleotidyltranferase
MNNQGGIQKGDNPFEEITMHRDESQIGILKKSYNKKILVYKKALSDAEKIFETIKIKHQKKATLRIAYIDSRIKSLNSVINKAIAKDFKADDIFKKIADIAGLRIVVNNLTDINPLIKEIKEDGRLTILEKEKHSGHKPYKAVHLKTTLKVSDKHGRQHEVPIEIQIRTLLQDAWAILTHHDHYKNQALLPTLARPISLRLSELLNSVDKLANDLRKHVEKIMEPPNDLSDDAPLNKQGLSFLYFEIIGEKPQEYEVEILMNKVTEYGLKTVGEARKGLKPVVLQKIRKIHDDRFAMIPIGYDLLEYGMLYAVQGSLAYKAYEKHIQESWKEIENIGRSEALSELPDTFEEFVKMIKDGNVPWTALEFLGGSSCARCGNDIFDPSAAADGVLDYYGDPDTNVDVERLINEAMDGSDCPFASLDFSGVCSYCDYQMSKDD